MPDQPAPSQGNVVSDQRPTEEIENVLEKNILDARRELQEEIEKLEKQRAEVKDRWTQALAIDLAEAPLSVDGAIERYHKPWNAEDEPLKAEFIAAKELLAMIEDVPKPENRTSAPQPTTKKKENEIAAKK